MLWLIAECFIQVAEVNAVLKDVWQLLAVLPAPKELYFKDFPNSVDECETLLTAAAQVIELPEDVTRNAASHDIRPDYESLGRFLIERSHILLALWDGNHLPLTGGASHVVRYKLGNKLPQSVLQGRDDVGHHARRGHGHHQINSLW